jgi:DNA-binding NarL/FixJ family response regulator
MGEKSLSFSYKAEQTWKDKYMTKKSILALVVSSSGHFQNGLLALVTTIPSISAVLVAEDTESALRLVENHQPALVILELSSCQVQDIITQIKTQWPQIYLIILVDDLMQGQDAETFGANRVLIKGFPPNKLVEVVEEIVASIETNKKHQSKELEK